MASFSATQQGRVRELCYSCAFVRVQYTSAEQLGQQLAAGRSRAREIAYMYPAVIQLYNCVYIASSRARGASGRPAPGALEQLTF